MNRKNTVDYQELLKRYYEGKTTLEEENLLRTHLLSHTEENHADATLFRILAEESQALPPDGMEQRLEAWIDRQPAVPFRKRLFLFWGAAAVAAALLCYVGVTHAPQQHNGLTPQETLIAKKALGSTLKCIETSEQSVLRTHERLKYTKETSIRIFTNLKTWPYEKTTYSTIGRTGIHHAGRSPTKRCSTVIPKSKE